MRLLLAGTAAASLTIGTDSAWAQTAAPAAGTAAALTVFAIPPQPLADALVSYSRATGVNLVYDGAIARGLRSPGVRGSHSPAAALQQILAGTGLNYSFTDARTVVLTAPLATPRASTAADGLVLDEVTVTAARAARPISEIPASVQVVERQEIQRQLEMTRNPAAVLQKLVPGFSVTNQTISSASETFRGRDMLVMIDGVPLNTPLRDVSRMLALLDLNSVERVEVVAGASSLYGSGATGGTINFITKQAEAGPPRLSINTAVRAFTANIGQSLAPEVSATLSGKNDLIDYVATATGRFANKTYDGQGNELPSDPMLGQGGADRYQNGNFFAKIGRDFEGGKRFEVSSTWIYLNQDPQWLTNYTGDAAHPDYSRPYPGLSVLEDTKSFAARYLDNEFALGALKVQGFYNDVKKRFNYSDFSAVNNLVYYSGDPANPTSIYNQTTLFSERGGVNVTVDTPLDGLWQGARLTWGGDVGHEKTWQTLTNGQDVFTPLKQTTYAGFAQLQVPVGERLTLRGGARYEFFDLSVSGFTRPAVYFGYPLGPTLYPFLLAPLEVTGGDFTYDALTFNAGATFKLTETIDLYGGFSQGFSLPDVGAFTRRAGANDFTYSCGMPPVPGFPCYTGGGVVSYANIGPKAQIVNNYEIGIRGAIDNYTFAAAGFVSTSDEGVTFDITTNTVSQQKEIIYGLEFTGEAAVSQALTIGTTLAFREGRYDSNKDGDIDSYLPNNRIATPLRGVLYGTYTFDTGTVLRIEGEAFAGRDRPINLAGTIYRIDPGATMNIALSHPVWGGTAYVGVQNLFDVTYENATATATRNFPVNAWGRTVTVGYRTSW